MPLASHQIIQRGINQHQPARVLLIALALAAWLIPSHRASALIGVGAIDTPGDAFDVEVVGGLAYAAIGVSGLQIIDFGPEYFLGWVLYDRDAEEISRFATITDLIADQSFAGAEPIAPTGFEAIASDRATWVLQDTDTESISRYAALDDLVAGNDIAGLKPISPTGFEGIASDGVVWVLYDADTEEIARYASLADLIAGIDIAGLEAIVPTGFEAIASGGGIWVLYDTGTEAISRYATLDDLVAGNEIAGLESINPTGFEGIAAVPEPGQLLLLVSGITVLLAMARHRIRP